ncbi:MAG: Gfo/Idh/MocA family oxidoreductase [Bacteroidia bacterium]|nr:Gfo/Idh/MocA family oxidoreductase [Bacteroidia bacterium]
MEKQMNRRAFLGTTGTFTAGALLAKGLPTLGNSATTEKKRLAIVGTGIRGIGFWGKPVQDEYNDIIEFVGFCDINPGRVELARKTIGVNCPSFTNFDEMLEKTRPDMVIVTTIDATHNIFIVKALEFGCDVLTEKPMTTDEVKCQAILDAERKSGKKLIVGFNYRHGTHFTAIKEILAKERVGKITSVDFHWYLNTYHGADYFRRWHGQLSKSGSLLVHKATHHFDLLNWWIDSDPVEVYAYGALEHYGKNHPFRGANCRLCAYTRSCKFFFDITRDKNMMELYVANEKYDGYIRDNCLWRDNIDIFDKMAVQIKYANNVQVSYSLTTYSPFEGLTIAFNGMNGRIDSWQDLPWRTQEIADQAQKHAREMSQSKNEVSNEFNEIMVSDNFGETERIKVPLVVAGHGGGDSRLQDRIFRDPGAPDPLRHMAGSRDGAMSALLGIAARKSILEGPVIRIEELTDLKPHPTRGL